jgi:hypothetical protein
MSGTIYFILSILLDFSYHVKENLGIFLAIILLLEGILGISSITYRKSGKDTDGTLQIDNTDPHKDIYRLQLNVALDDLSAKKKVILVVDPNARFSRE